MNPFGYANDLRTISNGRATFTKQFDRYADVPLPPDDDPPFRPSLKFAHIPSWPGSSRPSTSLLLRGPAKDVDARL